MAEKLAHQNSQKRVSETKIQSQTDLDKSPYHESPLLLNFEEFQQNAFFPEEIHDSGIYRKKCSECAEKDTQIEHLKTFTNDYEKLAMDNKSTILVLQEKVKKLNEQVQQANEEQLRTVSSFKNTSQVLNTSSLFGAQKRSNVLKESNYAQELLQKNLSREEENKRLKLRISKLNQELYENQKVYAQRVELLYSVVENYRN